MIGMPSVDAEQPAHRLVAPGQLDLELAAVGRMQLETVPALRHDRPYEAMTLHLSNGFGADLSSDLISGCALDQRRDHGPCSFDQLFRSAHSDNLPSLRPVGRGHPRNGAGHPPQTAARTGC